MSNPIPIYKVEVYDPSGNLIADLSNQRKSLKIKKVRNDSDTITLSYDLDVIRKLALASGLGVWDILYAGRNEIRVTRNTSVISAGKIALAYPQISGDTRQIDITVTGWLDLLAQRFTGGNQLYGAPAGLPSQDAGAIAWDLINTTQSLTNGSFGITQGTIQTSVSRDRSYSFKNIKDALQELSQVDQGFDFEITWDKVFKVWYPKIGINNNNSVFTYPGNIQSLNFQRSAQNIANEIIARGAGTGPDAFTSTVDDAGSQAKYGLRQMFMDMSDVELQATLTQNAQSQLTFSSDFIDVPSITLTSSIGPQWGEYGIGDIVPIQILAQTEVLGPINNNFRIDSAEIDVSDNNVETITLGMMNK